LERLWGDDEEGIEIRFRDEYLVKAKSTFLCSLLSLFEGHKRYKYSVRVCFCSEPWRKSAVIGTILNYFLFVSATIIGPDYDGCTEALTVEGVAVFVCMLSVSECLYDFHPFGSG